MIGKYFVNLLTKFALKKKAERGSVSYQTASKIGILYSYSTEKNHNLIYEFVEELQKEGKTVRVLAFIPKAKKTDTYDYPYFSEKDLNTSGKWEKKEVVEFKNETFDYLLSLDKGLNKYSKNILATCQAKCRVGQASEGVNEYFEMMINHDDENFETLLRQVHHYIKNIRNE